MTVRATQGAMGTDLVDSIISTVRNVSDKDLSLGQFSFVGLEEVRRRLGEDAWRRSEKTVHQIADSVLRDVFGDQCDFFRINSEQYLVILAGCPETKAGGLLTQAQEQLSHQLFGTEAGQYVSVTSALSMAKPKESEKVEPATAEKKSAPLSKPEDKGEFPDRQNERKESLANLFDRIESATYEFKFLPIWNCDKRAVGSFQCTANTVDSLGEGTPTVYAALRALGEEKSILNLDLDCLETALKGLASALQSGHKIHVSTDLNYEAIASHKGRVQILELLKILPRPFTQFFSLVLYEIPDGIPQSRLSSLTQELKPHVQQLGARVGPDIPMARFGARLQLLKNSGITVIHVGAGSSLTEEKFKWLETLVMQAQRQGMEVSAIDVRSLDDALRLSTCGVKHCSGSMFGGLFDTPIAPYGLSVNDLE